MFDIQEELKKLPDQPGVYIMHNEHDDIIYVGKAVMLRNRVRQYFQNSRNLTPKIRSMVSHVSRFEYIVTDSEMEALVLECNLIKEHRPRYNTMLKDDKAYPYIKITTGEAFPRVLFVRHTQKDKAKYFGPYTSAQSVRDTIELVRQVCRIRHCNRNLPRDTGKERPCLYYHMGQCDAPCQGWISEAAYGQHVQDAMRFLNGNFSEILAKLEAQMLEAAEKLDFEKAASLRDLITSIRQIDQKQKITSGDQDDRDVIAFAREEDDAVFQVFFIRAGKIIGREHFYVTGVRNEPEKDVFSAFVKQYYASALFIPQTLMLQHMPEDAELIAQWLSARKGQKVFLTMPQRGQKERLVELAAENARIVLTRDREKIRMEQARTTGAVKNLADMLGLENITRMEAFDISNISGVETVGSMIVYEDGRPRRNAYRKFRVRTVKGQDDYKSMEEVLTRRFSHGLREQDAAQEAGSQGIAAEPGKAGSSGEGFAQFPDILMMDGGKGQVNVALQVLQELGLEIPVCGMVKDDRHRTRALLYEGKELPIDRHSELFKLITRMQDEAHRFAIEYHRKLRGNDQVRSVLDEIKGIGPARRKALMRYFGDIEKIREAEVETLRQVDEMDARSAKAVYEYFH